MNVAMRYVDFQQASITVSTVSGVRLTLPPLGSHVVV